MAPVEGIRRTPTGSASVSSRNRLSQDADPAPAADSRALVAVAPVPRIEPPRIGSNRAAAGFLAHLIAIDQQAPQTRLRRRADPGQASSTYRAVSALAAGARPRPLLIAKVC